MDYEDRKLNPKSISEFERREYEATYICDARGGKIYWNVVKVSCATSSMMASSECCKLT